MKTTKEIQELLLEKLTKCKELLKLEKRGASYNCGHLEGRQLMIEQLLDFIDPIPF